ncbi:MAG: peptide deformylase [Polyangiaceae bacterium]|nr:peptide deformylase [Polyangiaceae bacterium]
MTVRDLAQLGTPLLRQRSAEVEPGALASPALQSLMDDLVETMREVGGAGLAAPQVRVLLRVVVIEVAANERYPHFPEIPLTILVNPELELVSREPGALADDEVVHLYEGCLSVAGLRGRVRRARRARVRALDRAGRPVTLDWDGVRAAVLQHEIDHLDGVLFVDRADPRTLCFQREYDRWVPAAARYVE